MERIKSSAIGGKDSNGMTNSRVRISERLNEISGARKYSVQAKMNLEKQFRATDKAIIKEAVTNPANIPVMKNVSIDLVTAVVPNLVAPELYYTQPIDSPDALVGYWAFEYGDDKSGAKRGQAFNSSMGLGQVAPWYASGYDKDKEIMAAAADDVVNLGFSSITPGSMTFVDANANVVNDEPTDASTGTIAGVGTVNYKTGTIIASGAFEGTITYKYDNVNEPTKIPTIFAGRKNLRMIAQQYALSTPISITAAEIARRSLSTDLRAELMAQGFGELGFEIDTLLLNDLIDNANMYPTLTWSAAAPLGVSRKERFSDFELMLYQAASMMENATGRFSPNYILTDSFGLWVLKGIPGFVDAGATNKTGSYVAGTVAGFKVICATRSHLKPGELVLIHRGTEAADAPGVYSPYIPIASTEWIPSQELGEKKTYYTWMASKVTNKSIMMKVQVTDFNMV